MPGIRLGRRSLADRFGRLRKPLAALRNLIDQTEATTADPSEPGTTDLR